MNNNIYLTKLYDYYGELLTDKQQNYFEDYYFNNLTLAEISENYNISRNAVHKQIKDVIVKLEHYEQKLNLNSKSIKINDIIKNIDENIQEQIKELI